MSNRILTRGYVAVLSLDNIAETDPFSEMKGTEEAVRFDAEPDGMGSTACGSIRPDWFVDPPLCYRVVFYYPFAYIIFLMLILIIYIIWTNFQKTLHFENLIFF